MLYASGMTAIAGLILAKLRPGEEIVLVDECYVRTRDFCLEELSRFGIVTRLVPAGDYRRLEAAITPATRLLFGESPTNPHLSVVDLERFAAIGRRQGVETAVDATLATPYNVRPLEFGVDYVLHSCTKYLGGHNDLLAGAVFGAAEKLEPLRKFRGLAGMINSPHNEHLLAARPEDLCLADAAAQRERSGGRRVSGKPPAGRAGLLSRSAEPSAARVARRTMRGFGGVVTFKVKDADWRQTADVVDAVRIPRIAASLGGVESLDRAAAGAELLRVNPQRRSELGIPDNMIRLACGIEDAEDLVADLAQALQR